MERFRTVWKFFGEPRNFPAVLKVFGQAGKFTGSLGSVQIVWKV